MVHIRKEWLQSLVLDENQFDTEKNCTKKQHKFCFPKYLELTKPDVTTTEVFLKKSASVKNIALKVAKKFY